jgi:nucleoside-diphosphate-sugar epimerase
MQGMFSYSAYPLAGGSGFIAAHVLDSLLTHGYILSETKSLEILNLVRHQVVTTVRSQEKGRRILQAYSLPLETLSYVVVSDIGAESAFDKAVVANPPFNAVIHTASPFYYGHVDPVKEILNPAIIGTTGILKAIKNFAPSVKRVAITSSFAAMMNAEAEPGVYSEKSWNPVTSEQSLLPAYVSKPNEKSTWRMAYTYLNIRHTAQARHLPSEVHGNLLMKRNPISL